MKKIIFVNAAYDFQVQDGVYPVGQVSLGTILKSNGYDVELVDFPSLVRLGKISEEDVINLNLDKFSEYIYNLNPNIVSFLSIDDVTHIQIAIANRLRKLNKDIVIIFGGPHVSYCPEEMLTYHTSIDLVAIGEGEAIVLDIMNSIKDKDYNKLYSIPGIGYRDSNNVVVINPEGPLIEDLDTLPIPDFELVPHVLKHNYATVEAGRGCFGKCTYCSSSKFWGKHRIKSIDRILNEIQYIKDKFNIDIFNVAHDSMISDLNRFKNLCKEIIKRNMKFNWTIAARIDRLQDEELIKLMKESGCTSVFIGIESGSPRVQKLIKKNLNVDSFIPVLKMLVSHGINPCLSFMYGFPFETDEDLSLTLKVIRDAILVGVQQFSVSFLSFMGKTELALEYQDQLNIDYDGMFIDNISNKEEFIEIIKKCPEIFYGFYRIKDINENILSIQEFVLNFIVLLSLAAPITYKQLMLKYDNDPLLMHIEIRKKYYDIINLLTSISKTKSFGTFETCEFIKLKIIQDYINLPEAEYSSRIKETLKFEMDIINFIMLKQTNTIHHYKLDPTDDTYNDPTSITFSRDKDNFIIYRKSTNYFTEDYNLYISPILIQSIKRGL